MATARIRGIYSTALTQLLLQEGYSIVQASRTQSERFRLEVIEESADLDVHDRRDLQGIHALGRAGNIDGFLASLSGLMEDVVIRKWPPSVDGIYKGIVKEVDSSRRTALLDIGPAVGTLFAIKIPQVGAQLLVQVERHDIGRRTPTLSTDIKIAGSHVVLLPNRQVKISRKILEWNERTRLRQLGEELATDKWGVLWRTSAANQTVDVLKQEVIELVRLGDELVEKAKRVEAPTLLREGLSFADVEFPALSKQSLDKVRKAVAPTIDGHHYYKACGKRVSAALDMAERMLEKGSTHADIDDVFRQTVELEYPSASSWISVKHVKLNGGVLDLGPALLETYDSETFSLRLRRVFKREGVYDGLAVRKEPDDYAITEAKVGDWHFKTRYFSKDGDLKGSYINLNTPVELYPSGIRYVDLEVDVCVWPDGRLAVLDFEKLEDALRKGLVTESLVASVKGKLSEIVNSVKVGLGWEQRI